MLVLLTRRQLELEARRVRGRTASEIGVAEEIMRIQDEMLMVARAILGEDTTPNSDAEAYIARIRRRLQRREEETETTSWALDGDEEADEGIYAQTDIPEEIPTVRQLIELVPRGPDRRFETLVRAISDLSRENPRERFVIFTQYRDTLAFLAEELGRIFGAPRIATLKGGPIEDKIAAMEDFLARRWGSLSSEHIGRRRRHQPPDWAHPVQLRPALESHGSRTAHRPDTPLRTAGDGSGSITCSRRIRSKNVSTASWTRSCAKSRCPSASRTNADSPPRISAAIFWVCSVAAPTTRICSSGRLSIVTIGTPRRRSPECSPRRTAPVKP